jgi:hypothetical protein
MVVAAGRGDGVHVVRNVGNRHGKIVRRNDGGLDA